MAINLKQQIRTILRRVLPHLPHRIRYLAQLRVERARYNNCLRVHDLPDIFHYWSNKYLAPKLQQHGINNPDHFFLVYCQKVILASDQPVAIVSIGSGNCDMEVNLAQALVQAGLNNFTITCVDINKTMLSRGRDLALAQSVQDYCLFSQADFNFWQPEQRYDVVIANQSLHHVTNLEGLFEQIAQVLTPTGYFLTSDMIGRNGHQRWPEALRALAPFWQELRPEQRYNQMLQRQEDTYQDHDCSTEGFEGVRAQDILPLLCERFHFELFIPFANIILVFIDRPFGHNFDVNNPADIDLIDRVHAYDEQAILSGELSPTQMLAALRLQPAQEIKLADPLLTPQHCIRRPQ